MTGQLFTAGAASVRLLSAAARAALAPEEQPRFAPDAHTHLRLVLQRRGPARPVPRRAEVREGAAPRRRGEESERLRRLGTDALALGGAALFEATRGRKVAIKSLLLDQSVVAGTGNIYADEALFLAGVRPRRPARRVTRAECEALAEAMRRVMLRSIETGGSSISDYVAPDGADGGYQDERRVYARSGEPCPRLRHADPPHRARPAQRPLLPALPALSAHPEAGVSSSLPGTSRATNQSSGRPSTKSAAIQMIGVLEGVQRSVGGDPRVEHGRRGALRRRPRRGRAARRRGASASRRSDGRRVEHADVLGELEAVHRRRGGRGAW